MNYPFPVRSHAHCLFLKHLQLPAPKLSSCIPRVITNTSECSGRLFAQISQRGQWFETHYPHATNDFRWILNFRFCTSSFHYGLFHQKCKNASLWFMNVRGSSSYTNIFCMRRLYFKLNYPRFVAASLFLTAITMQRYFCRLSSRYCVIALVANVQCLATSFYFSKIAKYHKTMLFLQYTLFQYFRYLL